MSDKLYSSSILTKFDGKLYCHHSPSTKFIAYFSPLQNAAIEKVLFYGFALDIILILIRKILQ